MGEKMSYDIDADGNKVFYEKELIDEEKEIISFEEWIKNNRALLEETYINNNLEEFPTSESICEIENNVNYQSYCENEYDKYLEKVE